MILVTGSTGSVGREVVAELLAAGDQVRAMTRKPAEAKLPTGVEVVAGDLTDSASLAAAFQGIERIFLFPPLRDAAPFVAAAQKSSLKHIVLLSSSAVVDGRPESAHVLARTHLAVETAVQSLPVTWTFLRPGNFASNSLAWAATIRSEGVVRAPFPGSVSAPIDARDIAAVAARALVGSGHAGAKYVLTGPEALTQEQQMQQLGQALGRELRFETIPVEAARAHLSARMPAAYVDGLLKLQGDMVGATVEISPTVREVTGRAPHPFAEWAREHVAAFR
jgi:uncharacterized protein YbjT (DUF2867 family)